MMIRMSGRWGGVYRGGCAAVDNDYEGITNYAAGAGRRAPRRGGVTCGR